MDGWMDGRLAQSLTYPTLPGRDPNAGASSVLISLLFFHIMIAGDSTRSRPLLIHIMKRDIEVAS